MIARSTPEERELASARDRLRRLESLEAQTQEAKARSERELASASERLATLGLRGRRWEGEQLRRQAAREQSALRLAEAKLAALEKERRRALERLVLAQERALAPSPQRGRAVQRPAPERVPERQLGLDLGL